jgi:hypothetical protein
MFGEVEWRLVQLPLYSLEVAMRKSIALIVVAILFVLAWFVFPEYRPYAAGQVRVEIPNAAKAEIPKWEYEAIEFASFDVAGPGKRELNQRGKQGWELCGTTSYPPQNNTVLILKRPLK